MQAEEKGGIAAAMGGQEGWREGKSLSCSSEQLFQQIKPNSPGRKKKGDEKQKTETGGRRICFLGLKLSLLFSPSAYIYKGESKSQRLIIL